ncbi:hypothetical protein [Puia dinghuensis]|uniref:Uncharacterized protein n=1 Tax=Puia dinghuensis TaxID=1792502 RepID=A0A8J2UJ78_9BACT|nr:hypothetical protein [Puia dinghuensis]GGB24640.1 hypothetical protein GCM10011511_55730 [Puia dinghuensis]
MKTQSAQMEVLFIIGTTFLSGDLCENDDSLRDGRSSGSSGIEQLEEACWNGLLQSMLPEIFGQTVPAGRNNHLYLWDIKATESFLQLDLGEAPAATESYFSINPYSFLSSQDYN